MIGGTFTDLGLLMLGHSSYSTIPFKVNLRNLSKVANEKQTFQLLASCYEQNPLVMIFNIVSN